jgi:hypothetical protein
MDTQPNEPAEKTSPGDKRKKRGCIGISWWIEIPATVIALIFVLGMFKPPAHQAPWKAKEAEVKKNLHEIQVAVEQYATDHGGQYPPYLIGGEGKYSAYIEGSAVGFILVQPCHDRARLSDPLLREGYLTAYPRNPFAGNGVVFHRFQVDIGDALYNGSEAGSDFGTRFGSQCAMMGNVMPDERYKKFTVRDPLGAEHTYSTFADVKYPCSDIWAADQPTIFLNGQFFYRSRSSKAADGGRDEVRDYILGAYGSNHTKGKDVIGADPTGANLVTPFGAGPKEYGNPNGIQDSVILVLTPGEFVPPKPKPEPKTKVKPERFT